MSLDVVKRSIEIGLELGAEAIEVFYGVSKSRLVTVEKDIYKPMQYITEGAAFRVVKNGGVAFSYTYSLGEEHLRRAIKLAIKGAEIVGEGFPGFPSFGSITSDYLVDELSGVGLDDLGRYYNELLDGLKGIKGAIPIGGSAMYMEGEYRIANSEGADVFLRGNILGIGTYVITREMPPKFAFGFDVFRKVDIDVSGIVSSIKEKIARIYGNKERKYTGNPAIIISPEALMMLLTIFVEQIKASNIKSGSSPYTREHLGERVGSKALSIIDNPEAQKSLMPTKVDFEGVPTKRRYIIRDGILETILNDYKHAKLMDLEPSANATRISEWGNEDPVRIEPRISAWHLEFEGKQRKLEDIIQEIKEGYLVEDVMGVHQADPASGKFTVPALVVKIKNGEIEKPTQGAMLSGTIGQLLQNAELISTERKLVISGMYPYILTRGLTLSMEKSPLGYRLGMKIMNLLVKLGIIKF